IYSMPSNKPNEPKLELSIIILSYNTADLTKQTIKSLYTTTKLPHESFEVIVLDNASKDNSIQILEKLASQFDNLVLIKNKDNVGFSRGNNIASEKAKGKYLLFLNSDIIVQDQAIDRLLEYLKKH